MNLTTKSQKYAPLLEVLQDSPDTHKLPQFFQTFSTFVQSSVKESPEATMVELTQRFSRTHQIPECIRPYWVDLWKLPAKDFFVLVGNINRIVSQSAKDFIDLLQEYKVASKSAESIPSDLLPRLFEVIKLHVQLGDPHHIIAELPEIIALWIAYDKSAFQYPLVIQLIEKVFRAPAEHKRVKELKRLIAKATSGVDFGGPRRQTSTNEWIVKRMETLLQEENTVIRAARQVHDELEERGERISIEGIRKRYYDNRD